MGTVLTIDSVDVQGKARVAEWEKYGIVSECVGSIHQALERLDSGGEFLFIGINERACSDYGDLLTTIRGATEVPICVSTDNYSEKRKTEALSCGVDIFVPSEKAVSMDLLVGLLELYATRTARGKQNPLLMGGDVVLSPSRHEVYVGGVRTRLTKKEYGVLQCLMSRMGEVVTHTQILKEVWGPMYQEDDVGVLWRTINRLRGKLSAHSNEAIQIHIVRGVGYKFAPQPGGYQGEST